MIFGKNCVLGSFSPADRVRIRVGANALLQIGEDSFINAAGINAMNRVIIGDHVMMAGIINDSNFHPVGQVSKYRQGPGEVIIKDCSWVGAGGAGGILYGGRMIARLDDPIWLAMSDFGFPFKPFSFDTGMFTSIVSRREANDLGIEIDRPIDLPPVKPFKKIAL